LVCLTIKIKDKDKDRTKKTIEKLPPFLRKIKVAPTIEETVVLSIKVGEERKESGDFPPSTHGPKLVASNLSAEEFNRLKTSGKERSLGESRHFAEDKEATTVSLSDETGHNGAYDYILRKAYFPFLLRYHKFVVVAWIIIVGICAVYGPAFLTKTRSSLKLPPGAPSLAALKAFETNYPTASTTPPVIIILHSKVNSNIVCSFSEEVSNSLEAFIDKYTSVVDSVSGYYQYIDIPTLELLALNSISSDQHTMMLTVNFKYTAPTTETDNFVTDVITWAMTETTKDILVFATGQMALFSGNFLLSQSTLFHQPKDRPHPYLTQLRITHTLFCLFFGETSCHHDRMSPPSLHP
jgi:hypothetical protein